MSKKKQKTNKPTRKGGHDDPLLNSECLDCNPQPKAEGAVTPKKPRKKEVTEPVQFAACREGKMKLFATEEAFEYAEPNSTIAKYETKNGTDFDFVAVVGIKTSEDSIGRLLQQ